MSPEPKSKGIIRVELRHVDLAELLSLDPLIGKATLFTAVGPEDTRRLVAAATPRRFGAGQAIYGEASPGSELYLILRGEVALGRSQGGTSVEICSLQKGEFFGEAEAMGSSPMRSQSAAAVGSADVAEFPRALIAKLAEKHLALHALLRETRDVRGKAREELADFLDRW